jgi:hypothetical protein
MFRPNHADGMMDVLRPNAVDVSTAIANYNLRRYQREEEK